MKMVLIFWNGGEEESMGWTIFLVSKDLAISLA